MLKCFVKSVVNNDYFSFAVSAFPDENYDREENRDKLIEKDMSKLSVEILLTSEKCYVSYWGFEGERQDACTDCIGQTSFMSKQNATYVQLRESVIRYELNDNV